MSPAEMKTLHEGLGVSTAFLADRIGISQGRVWEYESPTRAIPVPEHAAEVVWGLAEDFRAAAARLAAEVKLGGSRAVPRYVALEDFEEQFPALTGWGALTQGLLVAEVHRTTGAPVEYVLA